MKFYLNLVVLPLLIACSSVPKEPGRCPAHEASCEGEAQNNLDPVEPLARFEDLLGEFNKDLPASAQAQFDLYTTESLRNVAMQLQGLCKVYEAGKKDFSDKDEARIEAFRKRIRELENSMGRVSMRKALYTLSADSKVPADKKVQTHAQGLLDAESAAHQKFLLKTEHWLPDPAVAIKNHLRMIEDVDFQRAKKDQRKLAKYYLKLLEKTHEEIVALRPFIFKDKYSHEDLEAGLHEFRRLIRWLTISLQALRGVFAYSNNVPNHPDYQPLFDKFGSNKYVKLRPASQNHYAVDIFPFLRLSHIIMESGTLKDAKEAEIFLAEYYLHSEVARDQAQAEELAAPLVEAKYGKVNVERQAQSIYRYYELHRPIEAIIRNLRALIGEKD